MHTGVRFFGTDNVRREIGLQKLGAPTAGVKTNDIIVKHVHTKRFVVIYSA